MRSVIAALAHFALAATALRPVSQSLRIGRRSSIGLDGIAGHARIVQRDDDPPKTAEIPVTLERRAISSDIFFTIPVTVGTQTLQMFIDTGASYLYALGERIPDDQRRGRVVYKVPEDKCPLRVSVFDYVDSSSVKGDTYEESVSIGGIAAPLIDFSAVFEASSNAIIIGKSDAVGSMGLSPEPGTWLDVVRQQGAIAKAQVMFDLNIQPGTTSTLTLGSVDTAKVEGDVQWRTATGDYWSIVVDELGQCRLDHGGGIIIISEDAAIAYYFNLLKETTALEYSKRDGTAEWFVACDADMPPFTVRIDTRDWTVPGHLLKRDPVAKLPQWCRSYVQTRAMYPDIEEECLLGWPFLVNFITAIDLQVDRVDAEDRYTWQFGIGERKAG